jgi:hypothetical protein
MSLNELAADLDADYLANPRRLPPAAVFFYIFAA